MEFSPINTRELFGHKKEEQFFFDSFRKRRAHHAWIIHGEQGIGKATYAYMIAKFILIRGQSNCIEDFIIDHNNPYVRQIEKLQHPDFMLIDARKSTGNTIQKNPTISIEEIRQISQFLNLTAVNSNNKVVVIDGAEFLNVNAANALLKILEEPMHNSYLFLITNKIGNIPLTIKSRCFALKLKRLSDENFTKLIQKLIPNISQGQIERLLHFSKGNANIALMLHEQKALDLFAAVESALTSKDKESIERVQSFVKEKSENWEIIKYIIFYTLHNAIKEKKEEFDVINLINKLERVSKIINDTSFLHLDKLNVLNAIFV